VRQWCQTHQSKHVPNDDSTVFCLLCALALDVQRLIVDTDRAPFVPVTATRRAVWSRGALDDRLQHDVHEAFYMLVDQCECVDFKELQE
jgi:hypothetical protein